MKWTVGGICFVFHYNTYVNKVAIGGRVAGMMAMVIRVGYSIGLNI